MKLSSNYEKYKNTSESDILGVLAENNRSKRNNMDNSDNVGSLSSANSLGENNRTTIDSNGLVKNEAISNKMTMLNGQVKSIKCNISFSKNSNMINKQMKMRVNETREDMVESGFIKSMGPMVANDNHGESSKSSKFIIADIKNKSNINNPSNDIESHIDSYNGSHVDLNNGSHVDSYNGSHIDSNISSAEKSFYYNTNNIPSNNSSSGRKISTTLTVDGNAINTYIDLKESEAILGIIKLMHGGKEKSYNGYEKIKKSRFQSKVLSQVYEICQFPSTITRKDLSFLINLPARCIQVWFQNTRQSNKRGIRGNGQNVQTKSQHNLELEDVPLNLLLKIVNRCQKFK